MSSEEFTDDRMNCVRPEGQTLIHPVVQGHYTRYSNIKDRWDLSELHVLKRKKGTYGRLSELSTT